MSDDLVEIPDDPSRSDLALWERALRQDWPIPPAVKTRLLQVAVNLADPLDEETIDATSVPDIETRVTLRARQARTRAAAERVVAAFGRLTLEQQRLDLQRARLQPPAATDAPIKVYIGIDLDAV